MPTSVDAAFQGGQADDVLAAAAQPLGRAVRDVAQLLDDGQDPVPGVRVHEVGPCTTRDTVAVDTPARSATS